MAQPRVVAIHQPNFLPWLGFFHKMTRADVFILLDNVPYSKNGYQNRVRIKSAQGEQWLTVPVLTKGRFGQLSYETPIDHAPGWPKAHLAALRTNYRRAPCFGEVLEWLEPYYREVPARLTLFNQSLIEAVLRQLRLPTRLVVASALAVTGHGSELLLRLVQAVEGYVYLSGVSGRDYLDLSLFQQAGIEVRFQKFCHPVYPQLYGGFTPGLSIIDLLMNVGSSEAANYLQGSAAPFPLEEGHQAQESAPHSRAPTVEAAR